MHDTTAPRGTDAARPHIRTDPDALIIGADLGGTKVQLSLVDADGQVSGTIRRPSEVERGADAIVATIAEMAAELVRAAEGRPIAGLGIGVAGQVDLDTGTVRFAPNLRWRNVPLRDRLERATGMPCGVLNDVQAATYGEWTCGAGRGARDLVCIYVGTGVGGGAVVGGKLVVGVGGSAGEFGHTVVAFGGRRCRCGNHGCVEAYAGGWAIADRVKDLIELGDPRAERLLSRAGLGPADITARSVAEAAESGDPLAREILDDVARALGACAVSQVNGFNPGVVLLGGGVIEGVPWLADAVSDSVRRHALPSAAAEAKVLPTALGAVAGTVGAAAWLRWPDGPGVRAAATPE